MGKRGARCLRAALYATLVVVCALRLWQLSTESLAYYVPPTPAIELAPLLAAEEPDYEQLFLQTGLGAPAIDALWSAAEGKRVILRAQSALRHAPEYTCTPNSAVSREERTNTSAFAFANIEDGDILVTPCSHTFGWRNGHAALVIDAAAQKTLESVVLGQDSCVQSLEKWTKYPQVIVLRLVDASLEKRRAIANWAAKQLRGQPYDFTIGVLTEKQCPPETGTHCAHLVWRAYAEFGFDLDADGGSIVTPRDLAESPKLTVVQAYGAELTALAARANH